MVLHTYISYVYAKRVLIVNCCRPEWENIYFVGQLAVAFTHLPTLEIYVSFFFCFLHATNVSDLLVYIQKNKHGAKFVFCFFSSVTKSVGYRKSH